LPCLSFHNAPKIYGDDTVRRPPRVTGIKSGLRAAGAEFAYGIYDGWTGVVRLPYRGARRDGARGLAKGVGMGVTGFVLKDLAAVVGPVAYALKGVAKQAARHKQPTQIVRRARIDEGRRAHAVLAAEHPRPADVEDEVLAGWRVFVDLAAAVDADKRSRRRSGGKAAVAPVKALFRSGLPEEVLDVRAAEAVLAQVRAGRGVFEVVEEMRGGGGAEV
jgi:hypothetical protein